jgi:hyperosmotically inducible periplasmic protein
MKGKFLQLSFSLLIAFAMVSIFACNKKNKDPEIQSALSAKVQTDPNLAGVTTSVHEGTVTLTGTCADENCRTNAEKAVKDIDGVKKVVNNITVAPVVVTEDDTIRNSLGSITQKYAGVQADVTGGVVTLRGTIENREKLQNLMMELNALRPKRIDNQLVIKNK